MIKDGIIEPSSIFILNIHQFDATHLIDLPYSFYFLFRVCVCKLIYFIINFLMQQYGAYYFFLL